MPFPPLPEDLSIYAAADTHRAWLQWWGEHASRLEGELLVDASAVDVIDGAGLQLLVALEHQARGQGLRLVLRQPSNALQSACRALGMATLLGAEAAA
jgi:anti-anti-sigma regulatory factor